MEFKGVSQDACQIYIIDDKVHDEDIVTGYPLSGPRGDFIWSLLGSMSLLDKVRVGCWEGHGSDAVKMDIIQSSPKVVVGLGSSIMNEFVETKQKITQMSGEIKDIEINGVPFKFLILTSPSYVLQRIDNSDVVLKFSQDLYKAFEIINGNYKDVLKSKEILSAHSFEEFKRIYDTKLKDSEDLAYDIETNARPSMMEDSRIIGFSLANKTSGVYVSISSLDFEMSQEEEDQIWSFVINDIFEKKRKLVIHNTMYERPYTYCCKGYEIKYDKADDTLVMARLLKGAKEGAGLKYQAQKNLQYPDWETDLTNYISGFRGLVSRVLYGPKKFLNLWNYIKSTKGSIFEIPDYEEYDKLSDEDKEEVSGYVDQIRGTVADLYTYPEIVELGQLITDKLLTVEEQGGILDSTIPYNWIPDRVLSKYGAVDSIATYDLRDYFFEMMDRDSTDKVDLHKGYENWLEHMYVAYIMERNGLYWNEDLVREDEKFLTNQATNCMKSLLLSPEFEPYVVDKVGWNYKPVIFSDYLPQIPDSQGFKVDYDSVTGKYLVYKDGKRVAKGRIDEIKIPEIYRLKYNEIVKKMFKDQVSQATHYSELKDIYNPSSPTSSDIPRRILINDTLQMGGRVVHLHTLATSPEFEKIINDLPIVDQKFLKVAKLLCDPGELKSMYGTEWATKRKEIFEGFSVMYNSIRSRVTTKEIKEILDDKYPVQIESFDDGGIITVYDNLVVTGIDQDDRSTWTPQFEWMINFRLFKKSVKIISSYIEGSVGRQSVVVVDKAKSQRGDHCVPRKCGYKPAIRDDESYIMAAKWSPNTAETGRWRSAQHCHPGWTQIKLADGRDLPIEEVVNEFNQGKSLYVYSSTINSSQRIDESCEYRVAKVQEAYLSHYATEFVRLTLDNGEVVDMTPDHKMIRRDGTVDYAINIEEGDGLYPAYFKEDDKGYLMILSQGTWKYCHYLADEYNERHGLAREVPEEEYISVNGKYQPGWCRHHLDFNFRNNSPENVMRVGRAVHYTKYHMGNPEYYSKSWEHRRERGNDPCPDYYGRLLKKASEDPEFERKWKKAKHDSGLESMKRLWASEDFKKAHVERNKVRGLNKAVQLLSTIYDKDNDCITINEEVYETLRKSQGRSSMGIITWKSLMKYVDTDSLKEMVRDFAYRNHSVARKEVVTLEEPIPVYSLSIEQDSPNYVVSAGVCIKNTIPWGSQVKKYYTSRFKGGTCLTGDTKVYLLSGETLTIKELAERGNEGEYVLSYDLDKNEIIPVFAKNFRETRRVSRLVEVELSDGTVIKSTPDHLFYDKLSSRWVRAENLNVGDSLLSVKFSEDKDGYIKVRKEADGLIKASSVHRLVNRYYSPQDNYEGLVTHHIDENKRNNLPSNLVWETSSEHQSYHAKKQDRHEVSEETRRKLSEAASKSKKDYWNNLDEKELTRLKEVWRERNLDSNSYQQSEESRRQASINLTNYNKSEGHRKKASETMTKCWKSDEHRLKVLRGRIAHNINLIYINDETLSEETYNRYRVKGSPKFNKILEVFSSYEEAEEFSRNYNLMVVKVQSIDVVDEPVYCCTVDETHNFILSCGLVSHNCLAPDYSQMEVRTLAAISRDKNMLDLFYSGKDFHSETAKKIYRKDEVTTAERRFSKTATFSLLYGAMEESFARNYCNGDLDYARFVYGGFFEAYPQVKEWVEERHQEVQRDHRVSLELSGRFIPILPEGEGKGALNSMLRKSQNYPIQAQSADLTGCVIFDIQKFIEEHHMKSLIIMYVHDSIEVDVYPYELLELIYNMQIILNKSPMDRMGLPSKADVTLGKSLGHEIEMESIDHNEDFTEGIITLKGYQDEIYETVEEWKKAYEIVEIYDESWKEEFVSMGELFILRKAYSPNLGTLRHKGTCKVKIKYYE